ncbi:MAG: hypothetical protein HZB16_22875 [Armatimonadetes bacterium]|nr:hypothetical protein [Armatimonadota bacterium]
MRRTLLLLLVAAVTHAAAAWAAEVRTPSLRAETGRGTLLSLTDAAGHAMVGDTAISRLRLRCVGQDYNGIEADGALAFQDLPGARATSRVEPAGEELLLAQTATSPQPGVYGLEWTLAGIPRDYNIIVPGRSGIRLTKASPRGNQVFDWPMGWEAGLAIIEGQGHGFFVYADDPDGRFKRLEVEYRADGWRLGLVTVNTAPWDKLTDIASVRWRVGTYQGDWRQAARRYRDWQARSWRVTPLDQQKPTWVKDTRGCVIMGLDIPTMEKLAEKVDPRQTLIYLPDWRTAGYDRDYPTYDQAVPQLDPFLKRAHELGFRCMLHVNYFGCDPLNPLYKQFGPFQVRSPWGKHDLEWWLWEKAEPVIRFAYINPAHSDWRKLFVERMAKLCRDHAVDALHLDQTLCVFNDNNGLVEGQTMAQGNVALHRELRAALPEVAISGEGLNEVTYRDEAFAQRHAWGLNHAEGTWSRAWLATAHPVSSYLFRPYTCIYGYLGCASPSTDQLYAAWQEAYRWWGVIPTLKPDAGSVAGADGFPAQFWSEIDLWQRRRLAPDLDGAWPADTAFPLKAADGGSAAYTVDHRLVAAGQTVTRTVTGTSEVKAGGSLGGWLVYDRERLFGLDPERWYAWSAKPRDLRALHIETLPEGFGVTEATDRGSHYVIRLAQAGAAVARLDQLLQEAVCGTRHPDGREFAAEGPVEAPDGGTFLVDGSVISAHPPWRQGAGGLSFARSRLKLPEAQGLRFRAEVYLDAGAVGPEKSDGVLFGVTAKGAGQPDRRSELLVTAAQPQLLELDLTPLAGRDVALEMTVSPGPKGNPSFDWARWRAPRVERNLVGQGVIGLVTPKPYQLALGAAGPVKTTTAGNNLRVTMDLPGALVLMDALPADQPQLPNNLLELPFDVAFVGSSGHTLDRPQYAGANRVGDALSTHPPSDGRTCVDYRLRLRDVAEQFTARVGLREGSKSSGVSFIVEINGHEVARRSMLPGDWQPLTADLSRWRGQPVVLSLIADSEGPFDYDWALWGEPKLVAAAP